MFYINSLVRIATASNKVSVANPKQSSQNIISIISGLEAICPDIILFPMHCLVGGQCSSLLKNKALVSDINKSVNEIIQYTQRLDSYIIMPSATLIGAQPVNCVYVIHKGDILDTIFDGDEPSAFSFSNFSFCIYPNEIKSLPLNIGKIASVGADILLIPSYSPTTALSVSKDISCLTSCSQFAGCAIAVSNGGIGDTSFPFISKGFAGIFECGTQCKIESSFINECVTVYDVDVDIIRASKQELDLPVFTGSINSDLMINGKDFIMRSVEQMPYLPSSKPKQDAFLDDLFALQVASLAYRMQNTGINNLVIGVSGGLDSTLALLVAAKACDLLKLPKSNIIAVTMQGLGTSSSTYENAHLLMSAIGCAINDIPIKMAVLQHLDDIGHPHDLHDVTYENAQARERTQVLFDLANMHNALVVGTGDLSEAALGFCTFGGDHLASFNVNICITKTMIRLLVDRLACTVFTSCSDVLHSILDTPVSPELLPVDDSGKITQKTETILGEYELHDFFLYYFVKYNFSPEKILKYATLAFDKKYSEEYIKDKLKIFLKRIIASQFKRSCSVDFSAITELNLSMQNFNIPSDISYYELLSSKLI